MDQYYEIMSILFSNLNDKIYIKVIEKKKLAPMDVYHLLKKADRVDDIADHSENVAD